jgi:uncharacterized protein YkwD
MRMALRLIFAATLAAVHVQASRAGELGDAVGMQATMSIRKLDQALLARAIFAETNRVRRGMGLKELKASDEADEAAAIQASMCAARRFLGHENPLAGLATPMDRATHAGLKASSVAENIAVTPLLDVGNAGQIGIVRVEGETRYVNPETGKPATNHTYETFAAHLVQRWMDSPPHRRNIVNPRFELLGCASFPSKGASGADVFYSVQVFAVKAGLKSSSAREFKKR